MERKGQVPDLLDVAAFVAVFATIYGAISLALPVIALTNGSFHAIDLKPALLGAVLLALSFVTFRAHDRARRRSKARA